MRPIDADALLTQLDIDETGIRKYLSTLDPNDCNNGYDIFVSTIQIGEIERFRWAIEEAPTVEERPRGEWIKTFRCKGEDINTGTILSLYYYDCPKCKYRTGNQGKEFYFCPNCGADMRGEGE